MTKDFKKLICRGITFCCCGCKFDPKCATPAKEKEWANIFEMSENLLMDSLQLESGCENGAENYLKSKPNFKEIDDYLLNDNEEEKQPLSTPHELSLIKSPGKI